MTSRERILAAVQHRQPDRIPIDCGAMRSTGIQAIAYHRLKSHLGVTSGHTRVFDLVQQLAEPEPFFLDHFHVDAVNAGRQVPWCTWRDWVLPDGSPCQVPAYARLKRDGDDWIALNEDGQPDARMIAGATYFSQARYPLDRTDWMDCLDDLPHHLGRVCWASLPEPLYSDGLTDVGLQRIGQHVRHLRTSTERASMIAFGANLFEWASYLRRMDNFLMDLAAEPASAEALLDKLVEIHIAGLDRLLPVLGDNVDLIQLGDDLGMESGPFFSPDMYRKFFMPRHKAIIDHIKRLKPDLIVFLHCCGSIYQLLPDLIEAGVQVINPVQISAKDMEPQRLKSEFGRDITFWGGGCDTQKVLPWASVQEIRDHVRRNLDIWSPGGGYIFCAVHNILAEVEPDKVEAMYDAAHGYSD